MSTDRNRASEGKGRKPGAPRKRTQIVNGLTSYVRTAEGDATLTLELVKIARRIGVSDDTIRNYRDDPEIRELLQRLDRLRTQRAEERQRRAAADALERTGHESRGGKGPMAGQVPISNEGIAYIGRECTGLAEALLFGDATVALSEDSLHRQIMQVMREIEAAMLTYVGRCRRERDGRNVRRIAYDLDEALIRLHRLQAKLAPLAAEYRRREEGRRTLDPDRNNCGTTIE